MNAYIDALQEYAVFSGRASRGQFWELFGFASVRRSASALAAVAALLFAQPAWAAKVGSWTLFAITDDPAGGHGAWTTRAYVTLVLTCSDGNYEAALIGANSSLPFEPTVASFRTETPESRTLKTFTSAGSLLRTTKLDDEGAIVSAAVAGAKELTITLEAESRAESYTFALADSRTALAKIVDGCSAELHHLKEPQAAVDDGSACSNDRDARLDEELSQSLAQKRFETIDDLLSGIRASLAAAQGPTELQPYHMTRLARCLPKTHALLEQKRTAFGTDAKHKALAATERRRLLELYYAYLDVARCSGVRLGRWSPYVTEAQLEVAKQQVDEIVQRIRAANPLLGDRGLWDYVLQDRRSLEGPERSLVIGLLADSDRRDVATGKVTDGGKAFCAAAMKRLSAHHRSTVPPLRSFLDRLFELSP